MSFIPNSAFHSFIYTHFLFVSFPESNAELGLVDNSVKLSYQFAPSLLDYTEYVIRAPSTIAVKDVVSELKPAAVFDCTANNCAGVVPVTTRICGAWYDLEEQCPL